MPSTHVNELVRDEVDISDRDTIRIEKANNVAVEWILDELGLETAQEVLGEAEKIAGQEEPAILTVICAGGHVIVPSTGAVLINPGSDALQIHNFLNGNKWGDTVTHERQEDKLVPCAVHLSVDSSQDFRNVHGQFRGLSGQAFSHDKEEKENEEDSVGGLRIKSYRPESKLSPSVVAGLTEEKVRDTEHFAELGPMYRIAKALVMAKLATGAADHSDTKRPIESFDHVDPITGDRHRVHVEYRNRVEDDGFVSAYQKAVLVDDKGEKVDLSVADVAALYPRFYPGGPESGETPSGVAALSSDESSVHHKIVVDAKVAPNSVLDAVAERLLKVGNPDKPLVETFLLDKSKPISALNGYLLDELREDPNIADKIKFRPIIHVDTTGTDNHNFVLMETMLYEHTRKPDFENHNVGDRRGRNLTPVLLSPGVLVFRDDFMTERIPEMSDSYIVMVKEAGSWKVGRFTNAQELDDWMSE